MRRDRKERNQKSTEGDLLVERRLKSEFFRSCIKLEIQLDEAGPVWKIFIEMLMKQKF